MSEREFGTLLLFSHMSIAVYAVVKPSGLLFAMVCGICAGAVLISAAVAAGQAGNWALGPRLVVAGSCIFLALQGFYRIAKCRNAHHIDISGVGKIRLSRQFSDPSAGNVASSQYSGELVQLMDDSILWSGFLLLLLQTKDGQVSALPVLRDCVAPDDFRALAVACRWIVAHNNRAKSKIL